jgi:hypothetical protein
MTKLTIKEFLTTHPSVTRYEDIDGSGQFEWEHENYTWEAVYPYNGEALIRRVDGICTPTFGYKDYEPINKVYF